MSFPLRGQRTPANSTLGLSTRPARGQPGRGVPQRWPGISCLHAQVSQNQYAFRAHSTLPSLSVSDGDALARAGWGKGSCPGDRILAVNVSSPPPPLQKTLKTLNRALGCVAWSAKTRLGAPILAAHTLGGSRQKLRMRGHLGGEADPLVAVSGLGATRARTQTGMADLTVRLHFLFGPGPIKGLRLVNNLGALSLPNNSNFPFS